MSSIIEKIRAQSAKNLAKLENNSINMRGTIKDLETFNLIAKNIKHHSTNEEKISMADFNKVYSTIRKNTKAAAPSQEFNLNHIIKIEDQLGKTKYITNKELCENISAGSIKNMKFEHYQNGETVMLPVPKTISEFLAISNHSNVKKVEEMISKNILTTKKSEGIIEQFSKGIHAIRFKFHHVSTQNIHTRTMRN